MFRFGWFSTGRDKAARDLFENALNAINKGDFKAEIAFVFCSRESSESDESDKFISLVNNYEIPLFCYSYKKFKAERFPGKPRSKLPEWRLEYDRKVMEKLKGFKPDLCILAGYMLIVGREMCERYNMINLHPAAPGGPAGTWQEVIWQLMGQRATKTGVMMHLVTPRLDKGPVVSYCTFSITGSSFDKYWQQLTEYEINEVKRLQRENNPLFRLIRQRGLTREFPLILVTMKAFSQGKIKIIDDKVVNLQGDLIDGYDFTDKIEKIITKNESPHSGGNNN